MAYAGVVDRYITPLLTAHRPKVMVTAATEARRRQEVGHIRCPPRCTGSLISDARGGPRVAANPCALRSAPPDAPRSGIPRAGFVATGRPAILADLCALAGVRGHSSPERRSRRSPSQCPISHS